jgi:hypothetical protein
MPLSSAPSSLPFPGAPDPPQLPAITVVMPWRSALSIVGSTNGCTSEWLCVSMKPGARTRPPASIVRSAAGGRAPSRSTCSMRSPVTATEPENGGRPLPSTIRAPEISRSAIGRHPKDR